MTTQTVAPEAPAMTNRVAVASLVFSLIGILLDATVVLTVVGFPFSLVGLLCGGVAMSRSAQFGRRGIARWGFWLGLVAVAVQETLFLWIVPWPWGRQAFFGS